MPRGMSDDVSEVIKRALDRGMSRAQISGVVGVSKRAITRVSTNLKKHGTARPPPSGVKQGRPARMTRAQAEVCTGGLEALHWLRWNLLLMNGAGDARVGQSKELRVLRQGSRAVFEGVSRLQRLRWYYSEGFGPCWLQAKIGESRAIASELRNRRPPAE